MPLRIASTWPVGRTPTRKSPSGSGSRLHGRSMPWAITVTLIFCWNVSVHARLGRQRKPGAARSGRPGLRNRHAGAQRNTYGNSVDSTERDIQHQLSITFTAELRSRQDSPNID